MRSNGRKIIRIILIALFVGSLNSCASIPSDKTSTPQSVTETNPPSIEQETLSKTVVETGTVTGQMYFPSEYIPAMNLYFQRIGTQEIVTLPIALGQQFYSVTLPIGEYNAYAWLPDFGMSGAFTACTSANPCTDHTLSTITVNPGKVVTGVDIYDWYAPFGTFPTPPGAKRVGTLKGNIEYPYANIPEMEVYARNIDTSETFSLKTQPGQSTFQFDELPIGGYYLFAWTNDEYGQPFGGAYTCWKLMNYCPDHNLVTAVVRYHDITVERINDWSDQTIVPKP
jgi:hypothetical protein